MAARKVYLDTSCFIDAAKVSLLGQGKKVDVEEDRKQDVWFIHQLLLAHRAGDVVVYTSTLTIAECKHAGGGTPIDDDGKEIIRKMFSSGESLTLVSADVFMCEDARDLHWTHGINLGGADSVHVVSAVAKGCDEFLTTDGIGGKGRQKILKNAEAIEKAFGMKVVRPINSLALPADYRQEKLAGLIEAGDAVRAGSTHQPAADAAPSPEAHVEKGTFDPALKPAPKDEPEASPESEATRIHEPTPANAPSDSSLPAKSDGAGVAIPSPPKVAKPVMVVVDAPKEIEAPNEAEDTKPKRDRSRRRSTPPESGQPPPDAERQ